MSHFVLLPAVAPPSGRSGRAFVTLSADMSTTSPQSFRSLGLTVRPARSVLHGECCIMGKLTITIGFQHSVLEPLIIGAKKGLKRPIKIKPLGLRTWRLHCCVPKTLSRFLTCALEWRGSLFCLFSSFFMEMWCFVFSPFKPRHLHRWPDLHKTLHASLE